MKKIMLKNNNNKNINENGKREYNSLAVIRNLFLKLDTCFGH
jgi:hypothetical protein